MMGEDKPWGRAGGERRLSSVIVSVRSIVALIVDRRVADDDATAVL